MSEVKNTSKAVQLSCIYMTQSRTPCVFLALWMRRFNIMVHRAPFEKCLGTESTRQLLKRWHTHQVSTLCYKSDLITCHS